MKTSNVDPTRSSTAKILVCVRGSRCSESDCRALPGLVVSDPATLASITSNALPNLVDIIFSIKNDKELTLSQEAWSIVRGAFVCGLIRFFSSSMLSRKPQNAEMTQIVHNLLIKIELHIEQTSQEITFEHFVSPLRIKVIREMAKDMPHEVVYFSDIKTPLSPSLVRSEFEKCIVSGFRDVRNSKPSAFLRLEASTSGRYSDAQERRTAMSLHQSFLVRNFSQIPVFGQEDTGITLSQIYVKQRCIWSSEILIDRELPHTSEEKLLISDANRAFKKPINAKKLKVEHMHLGDLHLSVREWLDARCPTDAIRIVGGGPGSGKSTFAKALAVEILDEVEFEVIYVPLQDIDHTGTFEQRIGNLYHARTELGFDRVPSPLLWMGCREATGALPTKPLLIICDGLDEITAPDSGEATTATTDFVQQLSSWLDARNSGGFFTCVLVLGRTIAAEDALRKLSLDRRSLLKVAGLRPVNLTYEWEQSNGQKLAHDPHGLAPVDQRIIFWQLWCRAKDIPSIPLPDALNADAYVDHAIKDLTTEPLLLYLLLWTNYIGANWHVASENRNVIYREIFSRIYLREWGQKAHSSMSKRNSHKGGHTATQELSIDEFNLYQESLGLASWPTGARTVALENFEVILPRFLTPDENDDFTNNKSISLKSIALQTYTRSKASSEEGYEFVHKTLGEYLIARGLVRTIQRAREALRTKINEPRLKHAALSLSKVLSGGVFTSEIYRFFYDEIRLQVKEGIWHDGALNGQLIPMLNRTLKNDFPAHEIVQTRPLSFRMLAQINRATMDIFWSFVQVLADELYLKGDEISEVSSSPTFNLPIVWPRPTSFGSMFGMLSDRDYIAETKRVVSFDFLDISEQGLADCAYGVVLFENAEPSEWLSVSMRHVNALSREFYGSDLSLADFEQSNFSGARFQNADCSRANFEKCKLSKANFWGANLTDAAFSYADLEDCSFFGSNLSGAQFQSANLKNATFALPLSYPTDIQIRYRPALLLKTFFKFASLENVNLFNSFLSGVSFEGANLSGADLSLCSIEDCTFLGAEMRGTKVSEPTFRSLDMIQQQTVIIVSNDDLSKIRAENLSKWAASGVSEWTVSHEGVK